MPAARLYCGSPRSNPEPVNSSPSLRRHDPRSAGAAALSFLFPGLGQAYNRQWALASLLAVPVLLVLVLGILTLALGGRGVLSRLLDSRVLVALIVLDLALLGWRLVAILQAHLDRARLTLRTWPTWVTALLMLATVGMHALPAWYAGKAIDTLGRVSLEGRGSFEEHEGIDLPEPSFQPELGERVTVLLVGVDFAPGRAHHLTDTMLVATLDPTTGDVAMVSVPRDLYGVPLGDGRIYQAKLNALMAQASADRATYPLGGPGTLKRAIGELLGTQIHYFAAIDIEGMRQLINAVGGVDVVVERTINDTAYHDAHTGQRGFYIEAGPRHLDGATAMAYIRSRKAAGESDFTRAERQQQVLTAIAEKLTAGNVLVTLPALLDTVRDNVVTDVPSRRIPEIAVAAQDANLRRMERIVLAPPEFVTPEPNSAAGYILHPNFDAIRTLGEEIFGTGAATVPPEL
jgi:polyisoprenyl-teichoic acid--peptidoglycan teichoic acid transferase